MCSSEVDVVTGKGYLVLPTGNTELKPRAGVFGGTLPLGAIIYGVSTFFLTAVRDPRAGFAAIIAD